MKKILIYFLSVTKTDALKCKENRFNLCTKSFCDDHGKKTIMYVKTKRGTGMMKKKMEGY